MNKPLDPYAELGVPRDAPEAAIKRAFKRKAKAAHPDAGGSAEAFHRARTAMIVLTDPDRRARFDSTGTMEDEKPDNVRDTALQIIQKHMADIVTAYSAAKSAHEAAACDPRKMNVPAEIERRILAEIKKAKDAIPGAEHMLTFLRDMRRRFKAKAPSIDGGDPILRGYDDQIRRNEGVRDNILDAVKCHERAVEIIRGYDFEVDPPPAQAFVWPVGLVRTPGTF